MIKLALTFASFIFSGIVGYCFGVYSAIEANHSQSMNLLIKIISVAKRVLE